MAPNSRGLTILINACKFCFCRNSKFPSSGKYLAKLNPQFASCRRRRNKTASIYMWPLLALEIFRCILSKVLIFSVFGWCESSLQRPWKSTVISISHGEVCLFAGSPLAAPPMTCCVHILQQSLPAMRALFWTSYIWPCGTSMASRRLIELWGSQNWSAR